MSRPGVAGHLDVALACGLGQHRLGQLLERPITPGQRQAPFLGQPHQLDRLTGPRELVHGEGESFIGGYRPQRSGPAAGSPVRSVGGGGCIRVSCR